MALTIAAIVLLVINTGIWMLSQREGQKARDISGFVPQIIRMFCFIAWCWWFFGCAGRAASFGLYELVAIDIIGIVLTGVGSILAAIKAAQDARHRYWF